MKHRCRRCGRKPGDTLTAAYPLHVDGALAAQPRSDPERADASPTPSRAAASLARAVQRPLFQEKSDSKVIPFESYMPPRMPPPARRSEPAKAASKSSARRGAARASELQGTLDFLPAVPAQPRTLGTTVEAVIYCEAPVATPLHRAIAAMLDGSFVLIGYGLFLLAYFSTGGKFEITRNNLVVFGAALLLVAFTYGSFWAIAGTETAGMRWARLRLTTFDGFPPEWHQRLLRFAASCFSFCTVAGLLWSLADEESLAWHDHISRTFPTPRDSDLQIFHRR